MDKLPKRMRKGINGQIWEIRERSMMIEGHKRIIIFYYIKFWIQSHFFISYLIISNSFVLLVNISFVSMPLLIKKGIVHSSFPKENPLII